MKTSTIIKISQNRIIQGERGIGKFTLLFFGVLSGVGLYCAYNIIPFYYCYYELLNHMESAVRIAGTEDDKTIHKRLMYQINKCEIPVGPEDLKLERYQNRMKIVLDYTEEFYITWKGKDYTIQEFPFHAEVDKAF